MLDTSKIKSAALRFADEQNAANIKTQSRLTKELEKANQEYDQLAALDEIKMLLSGQANINELAQNITAVEIIQRKIDLAESALDVLNETIIKTKQQALEPVNNLDNRINGLLKLKRETAAELILSNGQPSFRENQLAIEMRSLQAHLQKIGQQYKCMKAVDQLVEELNAPVGGVEFNFNNITRAA